MGLSCRLAHISCFCMVSNYSSVLVGRRDSCSMTTLGVARPLYLDSIVVAIVVLNATVSMFEQVKCEQMLNPMTFWNSPRSESLVRIKIFPSGGHEMLNSGLDSNLQRVRSFFSHSQTFGISSVVRLHTLVAEYVVLRRASSPKLFRCAKPLPICEWTKFRIG